MVAPRESWCTNSTEQATTNQKSFDNDGIRPKVRIFEYHPADKDLFPDEKLPNVDVHLSVASGHGGVRLTGTVTQGSIVRGVWLDPVHKKNPVITSVVAVNQETYLKRRQGRNGFENYSGYLPSDIVSGRYIPQTQGGPIECATTASAHVQGVQAKNIIEKGVFGIDSPTDCEKVPLNGIMKSMQELIQKVERYQKQLTEWETAAQKWIGDKQAWIQQKTQEAKTFITEGIKWIFKEIRKWVEEQINKKTKPIKEALNPPDRDKAKVGHDALMELITCLFNKLIGNLFKMVGNFLNGMFDRYINVPACAVSNFIADLLGNTIGRIAGAIDSLINSVSGLIGGAFSLANSVLNFLKALAGFFACEEDQECPETKEWNIFEGGKPSVVFDIGSIIGAAQGIASEVKGLVSSAVGVVDTLAAAVDFSGLFNSAINAANGCNIGPVFCGPPQVTFWGGGGSGATGNVIVSAVGDILGIDIRTQGSGYRRAPFVDISDNCGKGSGASGTALIEPDGGTDPETGEPTYRVTNVVIDNPGGDYPSRPDGDLGGDGRVWAPAENTVIRTPDGRWEQYPPGAELPEREGDTILRPEDRQILDGGVPLTTTLPGSGNNTDVGIPSENQIANVRGTTSIPGTGVNGATDVSAFPVINIGSYPAILYLCDLIIDNAGINYSTGDKVVIEPNTAGAEVEATFGPFGVVTGVRIINPGSGFTERPKIYIESETGYNVILQPVFCVRRIGDDKEGRELTDQEKFNLVRIVDCVGRVD